MSSDLFTHNAYGILGLPTNATEREISRRAKEIINLLKIGEQPSYDLDLKFVNKIRSIETVTKAQQDLLDPNTRLKEYFFWFTAADEKDSEAMEWISEDDFVEAMEIWIDKLDQNADDYMSLKNIAIMESLIFSEKGTKKFLSASVWNWYVFIESDQAWRIFADDYVLLDGVKLDQFVLNDFPDHVTALLSDFYAEKAIQKKNNKIYAEFAKKFDLHGDKFQHEILDPLSFEIREKITEFRNLNIQYLRDGAGESTKIVPNSRNEVERMQKEIGLIVGKISDLGPEVWDLSQVLIVRDNTARVFRNISIDIHNEIYTVSITDLKLSIMLLRAAKQIVASQVLQQQIKDDLKLTKGQLKNFEAALELEHLYADLNESLSNKNFTLSIELIQKILKIEKNPKNIEELNETVHKLVSIQNTVATKSAGIDWYDIGEKILGWAVIGGICIVWILVAQSCS
jgi:hypothetical protein